MSSVWCLEYGDEKYTCQHMEFVFSSSDIKKWINTELPIMKKDLVS